MRPMRRRLSTDLALVERLCGPEKEAALDDIPSTMEEWRKDCDNVRPHGAIGNKAPTSLKKAAATPSASHAVRPGNLPAE
jgi:hypothetical protein